MSIDALSRYPDSGDINHTVHLMKYIFPRQFGLHNVFTSATDPKETTQPFKDYTFREVEINGMAGSNPNKLPKRLRGELVQLVQRLQKRHRRCAYVELVKYYCPCKVIAICYCIYDKPDMDFANFNIF